LQFCKNVPFIGKDALFVSLYIRNRNNLAGQVIPGGPNSINDISLRDVFAKDPKYRELKSINRKPNWIMPDNGQT